LVAATCLGAGCTRKTDDVWENTKTAIRYFNRTGKFWVKGDKDSRQVATNEAFFGPEDEEFVPLTDKDIKTQYAEFIVPQPKDSPGDPNSKIPGIEGFIKPTSAIASLFRTVHFNTDDHIIRAKEAYDAIVKMADFLKKNPRVYIFVEGHCDERASEAYNLALGTRRANFIRSVLVKYGAKSDQVYTISYGKEKPRDQGHNTTSWKVNRRSEFKIFEQKPSVKKIKN